jgi:methylated-DNA-[protein]-cysteine S-methyltransferase
MTHIASFVDTPFGQSALITEGGKLVRMCRAEEMDKAIALVSDGHEDYALHREIAQQLKAYFAGSLMRFNLPLEPRGTDFQRRVWKEMAKIPYGQTISYGELAKRAGNPKAVRAAGTACGANPLIFFLPCHRVVGSHGGLGGFGWGLNVKKALLKLEQDSLLQSSRCAA